MKKIFALLLAAMLLLCSCAALAEDTGLADVMAKGKLIMGFDEAYPPMGFVDENGEHVGFDIDLAKAVLAYLNNKYSTEVAVEFIIIDWNQKETMLENGSIDLVWNGMTITPEREAEMCISVPYLANKQVAVIKKADAEKYAAADAAGFATKAKDAIIIVEKGSAGEALQQLIDEKFPGKDFYLCPTMEQAVDKLLEV